jgi:KaiC/GvpD/RAD55 family RecA-like ATPase
VSEHIGSQFTKRLSDYQDGVIQMAFKNEKGERRRFLWIETIRETSFDGRRFEFTITTDGVQVIGRRRARS